MDYIRIEKKDGYAIIHMDKGTANAIDRVFTDQLKAALAETAADDSVGGIVLAGKEKFFSAGLDLIALYDYDETEIADFWKGFLETITAVTSYPKPCVAAITGHSPAGGCLLALGTDHRIMADGKFTIGLNEVAVGIIVPHPIFELYAFWIGKSKAYELLMEGKLLPPTAAKEAGIVHQVVAPEEVIATAEAQLKKFLMFNQDVWKRTKKNLRAELLRDMEMDFSEFAPALEQWWKPETRMILKAIVDKLTSKA